MKMGIELVLLTVKRHFESFLNHYLYLVVGKNCICPYKKKSFIITYLLIILSGK